MTEQLQPSSHFLEFEVSWKAYLRYMDVKIEKTQKKKSNPHSP